MTRDPLPPVLLSEVRSLGFPIILTCPICVHTSIVQLSAFGGLEDALTVDDLGHSGFCDPARGHRAGC